MDTAIAVSSGRQYSHCRRVRNAIAVELRGGAMTLLLRVKVKVFERTGKRQNGIPGGRQNLRKGLKAYKSLWTQPLTCKHTFILPRQA